MSSENIFSEKLMAQQSHKKSRLRAALSALDVQLQTEIELYRSQRQLPPARPTPQLAAQQLPEQPLPEPPLTAHPLAEPPLTAQPAPETFSTSMATRLPVSTTSAYGTYNFAPPTSGTQRLPIPPSPPPPSPTPLSSVNESLADLEADLPTELSSGIPSPPTQQDFSDVAALQADFAEDLNLDFLDSMTASQVLETTTADSFSPTTILPITNTPATTTPAANPAASTTEGEPNRVSTGQTSNHELWWQGTVAANKAAALDQNTALNQNGTGNPSPTTHPTVQEPVPEELQDLLDPNFYSRDLEQNVRELSRPIATAATDNLDSSEALRRQLDNPSDRPDDPGRVFTSPAAKPGFFSLFLSPWGLLAAMATIALGVGGALLLKPSQPQPQTSAPSNVAPPTSNLPANPANPTTLPGATVPGASPTGLPTNSPNSQSNSQSNPTGQPNPDLTAREFVNPNLSNLGSLPTSSPNASGAPSPGASPSITLATPNPTPPIFPQGNASFYYVTTNYSDPRSLQQAQQVINDAQLVRFQEGVMIQLGAFEIKGDAEAFVSRLQQQGINANIREPQPR
jgi:hypothetical protein